MNDRRVLAAMIGLVLLLAGIGIALRRAALSGPDPEKIAALEQALGEADPAATTALMLDGSIEARSVRSACAEALGRMGSLDVAQRATILADAFGDWRTRCPSVCADDLRAMAVLDPPKRTAEALSQCDRAGPDPVFGAPLAGLRSSMPPMDYLAVRMLTERADRVSPTFAALHPKLAVGLVLTATPAEMTLDTDLSVMSNRRITEEALADLQTAIRACGPDTVVAHRVVLDPEGQVAGVAASASNAHDSPCVVAALNALVLPADGAYAIIDLAWKPEPLPAVAGSAAPSTSVVDGPMPLEDVERVLRAHMGNIRYCYEKQLVRSASLAGDVVVRFVIAPNGRVSEADTISSDFGSASFSQCLEKAFRSWTFPKMPAPSTVTWPMHFAQD